MDRLLDRAFSKVHGDVSRVQAPKEEAPPPADDALDAIQRILKHHQAKEHFKLLGLPNPEADELGRPIWSCTAGDVSRAFRRLSVMVHPDKHPGNSDARAAFEALNDTHRLLKDPARLEEVLKEVAGRARREKEQRESRVADSDGRAALAANKNAAVKRLRKEEGVAFEETIRAQMRARQEEAARKQAALQESRAAALQAQEQRSNTMRLDGDSSEKEGRGNARVKHGNSKGGVGGTKPSGDSEESDDGAAARRAAAAAAARKRRKPNILH